MPRSWFGEYTAGRSPGWISASQIFKMHVLAVREMFLLQKQSTGHEASSKWREMLLQSRTYYVNIETFDWSVLRVIDDDYSSDRYTTPQFRLKVKIAERVSRGGILATTVGDHGEERKMLKIFYSHTLVVEFLDNFPSYPPRARIDHPDYRRSSLDAHSHHIGRGGWMCIFGGGREDWNPNTGSVVTLINVALDWMVLHFSTHGW